MKRHGCVAGLFLFLLGVSARAQDSMVISGLKLTLGTPRAEVEKAIQQRFQVELWGNGSWALWEGGIPSKAAATPRTVSPPRNYGPNDPEVREQLGPVDRLNTNLRLRVAENMTRADLNRYIAETDAASKQQAQAAIPRLPAGLIRFGDDGKLCEIDKELNPQPGTPADALRALGAALSTYKGKEPLITSDANGLVFFFPEPGRAVLVYPLASGAVSVREATAPCDQAPVRPN
jgi:hypothetical protein